MQLSTRTRLFSYSITIFFYIDYDFLPIRLRLYGRSIAIIYLLVDD